MVFPTPSCSRLKALFSVRPRLFSKYEWRYHLLMMPILFPLGNYYFIGPRYFRDPAVFGIGTALVFGLYWLSIGLLTLAVRAVVRRYPTVQQTLLRTVVMLGVVGGLTAVLAIFDVWIYSITPGAGVRFSWAAVRPIWVLGLSFDFFLCLALSLFYTYSQWQQDLVEDEQLQREGLQHQYDRLKGQLNPHFLFNSLNSLSVLIGEEPERAEQFVDKMARVYRYMLQGGRSSSPTLPDLVTLQSELDFVGYYADLLLVRYGERLRIDRPTNLPPALASRGLPPLSLLTLIDNAVKHNAMSEQNPLVITMAVSAAGGGELLVSNNRQPKSRRLETGRAGLAGLAAKYRLLGAAPLGIEATDPSFTVRLPLLDLP